MNLDNEKTYFSQFQTGAVHLRIDIVRWSPWRNRSHFCILKVSPPMQKLLFNQPSSADRQRINRSQTDDWKLNEESHELFTRIMVKVVGRLQSSELVYNWRRRRRRRRSSVGCGVSDRSRLRVYSNHCRGDAGGRRVDRKPPPNQESENEKNPIYLPEHQQRTNLVQNHKLLRLRCSSVFATGLMAPPTDDASSQPTDSQ